MSANYSLLLVCRRDSRDRTWRNGDIEAYGEQGYYSREEDNDSISSRDRYAQTGLLTDRYANRQVQPDRCADRQVTHS